MATGARMRISRFPIPALAEARAAADLSNALTGVSGVARITVDVASRTLAVEYDPDFVSQASLGEFIQRVGYPTTDPGAGS